MIHYDVVLSSRHGKITTNLFELQDAGMGDDMEI